MTDMDLLLWARGPGLQIATAVLLLGLVFRLLEIYTPGRKSDLSEARASGMGPGFRTIISRSIPLKGMWTKEISGYTFHIGFFIVLLFFVPHILLFKDAFGFGWPGLSNSLIDFITVLTLAALAYSLFTRITDPVRRFLSTFGDYLALLLTALPLITGYMAFHRLGLPYTQMLAIHILSVEVLMVFLPFTKLVHAVTILGSRWYNGAISGRKGVQS